jgi:hypothetical protein
MQTHARLYKTCDLNHSFIYSSDMNRVVVEFC